MAATVDINDLDLDFQITDDFGTDKENNIFPLEKGDFNPTTTDFLTDPFGEQIDYSSNLNNGSDLLQNKCNDENEVKDNMPAGDARKTISDTASQDVTILKYDEIFGNDPFKDDLEASDTPANPVDSTFPAFQVNASDSFFLSSEDDKIVPNDDDINKAFQTSENSHQPGNNQFTNLFDTDFKDVNVEEFVSHVNKPLPDLILSEKQPTHCDNPTSKTTVTEEVAVSISDVPIQIDQSQKLTDHSISDTNLPNKDERVIANTQHKEHEDIDEATIDLSQITSSLKDQAQDFDSEFDFDAPNSQKAKETDTPTTIPSSSSQSNAAVNHIEKETDINNIPLLKPTCNTPHTDRADKDSPSQIGVLQVTHEEPIDRPLITSSEADWENVETIVPEFQGEKPTEEPQVRKSGPLYTYEEAYSTLHQADYSKVKTNIKSTVDRSGLSAFVHFIFGPPKLHRDLIQTRDFVFCLSASCFDDEQPSHTKMLQTIYRLLTGSRFDSPRFGSHWEEIGFQGRDPSTDLRGVGVLGLVQLLYFLQHSKYGQIARDIYKLSLHPTQNFPFCVMGMNISRICLQSLREDILNKEINRRHDVMMAVNDFYVGVYLHMYKTWKMGRTISDSGFVLKDVEAFAKKHSKDVFKNLEQYIIDGDTKSAKPEKGEEFFSVC